ncbi:hypothetical protein ABI59_02775 [Acidobacteria bacterium Mor1]|nr:hypothetical protein ABI59_02775 [Acidobacteria bacterium Mor1]
MNTDRVLKTGLLVLLMLATAGLCMAQDDGDGDESSDTGSSTSKGAMTVTVESWTSQLAGTNYVGATRIDEANPLDTTLIEVEHGTQAHQRYRFTYQVSEEFGGIAVSYYDHRDFEELSGSTPGRFIFGQTLTFPLHAGFNDDGLSDAFSYGAETKLRDFRIDYFRKLADNDNYNVELNAGWRRVFHGRKQGASYSALVPGLPPLLPPLCDTPGGVPCPTTLDPLDDRAFSDSQYKARGPSIGLRAAINLHDNKVFFDAEVGVALLRGDVDVEYNSTTRRYVLLDSGGNFERVLAPPYSEIAEFDPDIIVPTPLFLRIRQEDVSIGRVAENVGVNSLAVEAALGIRWNVWTRAPKPGKPRPQVLELRGGIRLSRLDDAGIDVRPGEVTTNPNGEIVSAGVEFEQRSVLYEGFYGGLTYHF